MPPAALPETRRSTARSTAAGSATTGSVAIWLPAALDPMDRSGLVLQTFPQRALSERLGHSRPSTTSDRYALTLALSQDEAAAVKDAILGASRRFENDA
jgi:hypothetical protein